MLADDYLEVYCLDNYAAGLGYMAMPSVDAREMRQLTEGAVIGREVGVGPVDFGYRFQSFDMLQRDTDRVPTWLLLAMRCINR